MGEKDEEFSGTTLKDTRTKPSQDGSGEGGGDGRGKERAVEEKCRKLYLNNNKIFKKTGKKVILQQA